MRTTTTFRFDGRDIVLSHRDMSAEDPYDDDEEEDGNGRDGGERREEGNGREDEDGHDDEDEAPSYYVDPHFFDEGYTMAASTGFTRAWEASEVLVRLMEEGDGDGGGDGDGDDGAPDGKTSGAPDDGDDSRDRDRGGLDELRSLLRRGGRVVELGSGVGLVGICAAAAGGRVLLTDLRMIVDGVLRGNVERNGYDDGARDGDGDGESDGNGDGADDDDDGRGGGRPWPDSVRIGRGTASVGSLDWNKSIDDQVVVTAGASSPAPSSDDFHDDDQPDPGESIDPRDGTDLIIVADCTWLPDLLGPCVSTAAALMRGKCKRSSDGDGSCEEDSSCRRPRRRRRRPPAKCVLAHRERDSGREDGGGYFLSANDVVSAFEAEGCRTRVLRRVPSREDEEGRRHIIVYEFTLPGLS